MAARPLDYGDQYPSDTGDVKPNPQTTNMEEVDYQVVSNEKQFTAKNFPNFQPDLQAENQEIKVRDSYAGVIIRKLTTTYPPHYEIVTEDGRWITAAAIHTRKSNEYQPGQHVSVYRGFNNIYYVTSTGQPERLQVYDFTVKEEKTTTSLDVTWQFREKNVNNSLFSNRENELDKVKIDEASEIEINQGGLFAIDVELTIEVVEEDATLEAYIYKTPSGGIAGRSGTTVSSASCDRYKIVSGTLTDTGVNDDVYNLATGGVAENTYIMAKKESATGFFCCDMEDCG